MTTSVEAANNSLKELESKIEQLQILRDSIQRSEEHLAELKKEERQMSENEIPEMMEELGQEILRTPSGITVELKDDVFARIPLDKKNEAFQWLRDHNEGGMIKEVVDTRVHPQTLKAWVRGRLEEGLEVPDDLFGVYIRRSVKVKNESNSISSQFQNRS